MSESENDFLVPTTNIEAVNLNRLARVVLTEAKSTRTLRRNISNSALMWAAIGVDENIFERSSYAISRNGETNEWHMRYNYLRQVPDDELDWRGVFNSYDLRWNTRHHTTRGKFTEYSVPSVTKEEAEKVRELILMERARGFQFGARTIRQLEIFENMSSESVVRPVLVDEVFHIEETIVRLNQARLEHKRQRIVAAFTEKAA